MRNSRKVVYQYYNGAEPPVFQTYTSNIKKDDSSA